MSWTARKHALRTDTGVENVEGQGSPTVGRVETVIDPKLPGDHRRDGRLEDEVGAEDTGVDEQVERAAGISRRSQAALGGAARKLQRGGRPLRREGKDPETLDANPGAARPSHP